VRRRDFAIGLLVSAVTRSVRAQERAKQHRIAVIAAGPVARIHDPGIPLFQAFLEELGRLGDVEGENLTVEGIPAGDGPRALPISPARSSAATRR